MAASKVESAGLWLVYAHVPGCQWMQLPVVRQIDGRSDDDSECSWSVMLIHDVQPSQDEDYFADLEVQA